jgi:hypothetical protein
LKVSLKPHDPNGGELPIVPDLTTTDESAWLRSIGLTKTGDDDSDRGQRRRRRNRVNVEVGLSVAKAGTDISSDIKAGPVVEECGVAVMAVPSRAYQQQMLAHR